MSVELVKYADDEQNHLLISKAVASQSNYNKYLLPGIRALGIKYFQDGATIKYENKEAVLEELRRLVEWIEKNVEDDDVYKSVLLERLPSLSRVIDDSLQTDNDVMYLY